MCKHVCIKRKQTGITNRGCFCDIKATKNGNLKHLIMACLKEYAIICLEILRATVEKIRMGGIMARIGNKGFGIRFSNFAAVSLLVAWYSVVVSIQY